MMNESIDDSLLLDILHTLPDAVLWAFPVRNTKNHIIDFEIGFSNKEADNIFLTSTGSLIGLRYIKDGIPERGTSMTNFKHFLDVYETGIAKEVSFFSPSKNAMVEVTRRRFKDGVLSITKDRNAQREVERNEEQQTNLLKTIIQNAPAGIVVYKAVRNAEGKIINFRVKLFNQEVNRLTGFSDEDRNNVLLKELLKGTAVEQL
jgi:PAS domain-containing protein